MSSDESTVKALLGGEDLESVVSSDDDGLGEERESGRKDYLRGLAQRFTDPYFKERKAKGPFVYVQQANKPGHHYYVKEEIGRLRQLKEEERLRAMLRGGFVNLSTCH
jgi:hypothetical protein